MITSQNLARAEYERRLDTRRASAARQERLHRAIGNARLFLFIVAGVLAWLSAGRGLLSAWWILAPACVFALLVVLHERVLQSRRRFDRAAAFYERGMGRLEDRWIGGGEPGDRYLDPSHPYAADLDIFGKGSLFELLCTARTRMGEDTLAAWLRRASSPQEIRKRQAAIDDLRPGLDLREDLSALGADVRSGVDPEALASWSSSAPLEVPPSARVLAFVLGVLALGALVLWLSGFGSSPLLLVLLLEMAFSTRWRKQVARVIQAVERPGRDLSLLAQVLERLEREQTGAPRLKELRAALDTQGMPPSRRIARLRRLLDLLDSRRNQFFAPIALLLLWGTQCAFAIERWRKVSGPAVSRWLDAVGEMEALSALAGYAYEHPGDPFPELVEDSACFEGDGLGHPLIPEARCVRNDVRLGSDRRVLIVSGSNMSGKSTLLRTLGTNAVLALAGAPVRARRLRLSPLAVGASIRIQDSLQGGSSRFYAEITRLRQLLDLTQGPVPLLFLLDELLAGTNSHDRRIGAEAVVRGLVERGAIGLITTHDLALAHIAEVLAPRAANVHFEDHLENGRIAFDYLLREGIVRKSNALELMRAIGLEV